MKEHLPDTSTSTTTSEDALLSHPAVKELKRQIIQEAIEKYSLVWPVGRFKQLEECFTILSGFLLFWFNTSGDTTRVLRRELPPL